MIVFLSPTGADGIPLDMEYAKFVQIEGGKVLSVIGEIMSVSGMIAQCELAPQKIDLIRGGSREGPTGIS